MKNILFLFAIAIFFISCKEEPVEYNLMEGVASQRKVIIEEFTGVNCVNCPAGSEELENLLDIFGNNLITISIHSGFFAMPHPDNNFDFRTDDGEAITTFVGAPSSWPSAVINQKQFDGEDSKQTEKSTWSGYISSELAVVPQIDVKNEISYNELTRELELNIALTKTHVSLPENLKITVLVTESNIIDQQLTPEGYVADYVHKHVFRAAISEPTGDFINETLIVDEVTTISYGYTIPEDWNPANCEIVAFVSLADDTVVIQADSDHLVE